jgi:hypothetical protein
MNEHEILARLGIPAEVSAAYDILTDDGIAPEKAAEIATAAWRQGKDPEAFARHFVKLRKAFNGG